MSSQLAASINDDSKGSREFLTPTENNQLKYVPQAFESVGVFKIHRGTSLLKHGNIKVRIRRATHFHHENFIEVHRLQEMEDRRFFHLVL